MINLNNPRDWTKLQTILKAEGQFICETLLYAFNLILETGIFPEDLKQATVTPVFKANDKSDCGS